MKILVTGINGQTGWELQRKGQIQGFRIIGLDRAALDITDPSAVSNQIQKNRPNLVINCAAYTSVDQAEAESAKAFAVNCDGPALLAESCRDQGIPLIHLSTDYVFHGNGNRPYKEADSVTPLGVYGRSKEAGEQKVRQALQEHLIIRTSWLYGIHGHNFIKTMLRLGKDKDEIRVINDQWGCPTFAGDLAQALLAIAATISSGSPIPWGTYHCCGSDKSTWYSLASELFELAGELDSFQVKQIIPISTSEYPTPAQRPAYSVLDCSQLKNIFGLELPGQRAGLRSMLEGIYSPPS